jgi:HD-GYP domain-containing protein (c-di-GMP phosphodiesterase class II)
MAEGLMIIEACPHCGMPVKNNRYVQRTDGSYRCEHCYFKDTYLDGVVDTIETSQLVTLEAFVSAIDAREHEVGSHSLRVTQFAVIIGRAFGTTGRDLVDLYCGALLHDVGKIGVPDAVLLKKGPLTDDERKIMRNHPEIGHGIISRIGYFAQAAEIIRAHHEHFDGTGYPRGLRGRDIPPGARVFAAADALDALTVKRPYHEAVAFDEAREKILRGAGKSFDPAVVDAFSRAAEELRDYVGKVVLERTGTRHIHS